LNEPYLALAKSGRSKP